MTARAAPRRALVLSDDLTGAVAAASEAARVGASTRIVRWDALPREWEVDALVVDTNSRMLEPVAAAQRVAHVLDGRSALDGCLMYKRLDSQLRGNTAEELAAWAASVDEAVVLAPAAPAYGITTVGGLQRVQGKVIEPSEGGADGTRIHPYALLEGATHVPLSEVREPGFGDRIACALAAGRHMSLDAELVVDLHKIARAVRAAQLAGTTVALSGAYGLLGAWFSTVLPRSGPGVLLVSTSYREATLRQLEVLRSSQSVEVLEVGADDDIVSRAVRRLSGGGDVAIVTLTDAGKCFTPQPEMAREAAALTLSVMERTAPAGLALLGGEVSSEVIRRLDVSGMTIVAEPWPATPIVRIRRPDGNLLAVIQSGSQGEPTRALHAINLLRALHNGRLAAPNQASASKE